MAKKLKVPLDLSPASEVPEELAQGAVDVAEVDARAEAVPEVETVEDVGATFVEPDYGPAVLVRATENAFQGRMYNPYFKVYIWAAEPTLLPYLDNWTQCQIDSGLIARA